MTATQVGNGAALSAVAERVLLRREQLARRTVERFRLEIVGWQVADEADVATARRFALRNIDALVRCPGDREPLHAELLHEAREVAARRAHQGVSLEALLQSARVWGATVWESVLAAAELDRTEEREAALTIASNLWRHVDVLSTTMAYAYLDEVIDRGLQSRELLDALLTGQGDGERARRLARTLHRPLGENYVVVLIRCGEALVADGPAVAHGPRIARDRVVDAARARLCPSAAPLVVGLRQGDVVALYPASEPGELETVKAQCAALTDALDIDVSVGVSGWHAGRPAIASAYAEAREAAEIAAGTGIRGRAVVLDDVLVDLMLRASPHARRILRDTLEPVVEYDRTHRSELVATLRAYLGAGPNLTQSARVLTVHPNTVVYRLRRIRELSGRDPQRMEDLQVLFLALKLGDLTSARPDGS
jgi:PucR C-terminal helix-turn-helix domain/GGDEF-like domain